jgi:hypothetical protein
MNTDQRNNEIEKMIESGELSVMTECAYGKAIADDEKKNVLKNKTDEEK